MTTQPKVSVIVPIYNAEKTLRMCVDSIRAQTLDNIEIILVDDGSTDTSFSIMNEYTRLDARIKAYHKENGGTFSAYIFGIERSSGEYIGKVDSDDSIAPDMYETMYAAAAGNNCEIVICNMMCIYKTKKKTFNRNIINFKGITELSAEGALKKYYGCGQINTLTNIIAKKELFIGLKLPDFKATLAEDVFASHQLYLSAKKTHITDKPFYIYLKRVGSISLTYSLYNAISNFKILQFANENLLKSQYGEKLGYLAQIYSANMLFASYKNLYGSNEWKTKTPEALKAHEQFNAARKKIKLYNILKTTEPDRIMKIKMLVVALGWARPVCWLFRRLSFLPFVKYNV